MDEMRTVRSVTLELLRAGPPHNQLLSPLTPYLAVCSDAAAKVVHVPWEHAPFLRRIEDMRYDDGAGEDDHVRRLAVLDETGGDIAGMLGEIPAMSSVIGGDQVENEITHIRLVLSASELALIPFELSKVPSGLTLPAESWLLLQANKPVCLTRRVRSVSSESVPWDRRARILFVAGDPDDLDPVFAEHSAALVEAVAPWLRPGQEKGRTGRVCGEKRYGDVLTIKADASIAEVNELCEADVYTHVHVLAHGARDELSEWPTFGIGLHGEIVTGARFASAIRSSTRDGGFQQPTVVTLASCDSANVANVMTAGASFAHAVHQNGVPMVVASQFPLSFEGSVIAVRRMYGAADGFLWGCNPLLMLQDLRLDLQIRMESAAHDWASVVVYEALPPKEVLDVALERYAHRQADAARRAAESRIKDFGDELPKLQYETARKLLGRVKTACRKARGYYADEGRYVIESRALRGANYKKLAEAEFWLANKGRLAADARNLHLRRSRDLLDHAYGQYRRAVDCYLNPRTGAQLEAQPHYVSGQVVTLENLLGHKSDDGLREFARISAQAHLRLPDSDERAWALGTLIALEMLGVVAPLRGQTAQAAAKRAVANAEELTKLYPERGEFPVFSTYREIMRYVSWWGDAAFRKQLATGRSTARARKDRWPELIKVAEEIMEILKPRLWQSQRGG